MTASPETLAELAEAVRASPRVLPVGGGTKPRLSQVGDDVVRISTRRLRGIVEYEAEEFTFTALAGTPMREIAASLAEKGQYLPFDPMLTEAGATLGGTVASGISGPGRFRFGGLRDFILGVRFVDGGGRLLRLGGKVVKNAAGFDVPKFLVGSAGRFGVLGELTFKVFPRPPAELTLRLPAAGPEASTRWEPEALDVPPGEEAVFVRLAAPRPALEAMGREIISGRGGTILEAATAEALWSGLREFRWIHPGGVLFKVALAPLQVPRLASALGAGPEVRLHVTSGGNAAFVSLAGRDEAARADTALAGLGLSAMTLRGEAPLWMGARPRAELAAAVKDALDPGHRFPDLDA